MSSNTIKRAKERWQFGKFVSTDPKWIRRYQRKLWRQEQKKK